MEEYWIYFPFLELHGWGKGFAAQPQTIYSAVPQISAAYWLVFYKTEHGDAMPAPPVTKINEGGVLDIYGMV